MKSFGYGFGLSFGGLSKLITLINAFKARVLADSGTFEAEGCLNTSVQDLLNKNLYDSASLIVTPNAVKAGKIYALKGTDLTFTRASVANRTNSVGVLESMATGVPRIEYPIGGGCPSILLEPQRTNNFLYSNTLTNGIWQPSVGVTVTQSGVVSPDGTVNAWNINFPAASPTKQVFQVISLSSNTYLISVLAKSLTGKKFRIKVYSGAADIYSAEFTTTTNWQLFTYLYTGAVSNVSINNDVVGNTGDLIIYNPQIELGSFATSPIITTGAAVTRLGDVANISSASSLIGQTSGVAYFEAKINNIYISGGRVLLVLSDGTSSNRLIVYIPSAGDSIDFLIQIGGVTQVSISKTALVIGTYKVAVAYANNDAVMYVNGIQIGTDSSVTIPAMSKISIGSDQGDSTQPNALINIVALYTSRLTNAQLISQTT